MHISAKSRKHMRFEEEYLFAAAAEHLSDEALQEADAPEDPLFNQGLSRYEDLYRYVTSTL